jgi:hypothetical protein
MVFRPLLRILGGGACLVLLLSSAATAATPQEAAAELDAGVYADPGAEAFDVGAVRAEIAAAGENLSVSVFVLADPQQNAVTFAEQAGALVGGTVLVFTPSSYGVFSNELSQSDLADALSAAEAGLSGPDIAEGVAAFIDAAVPTATPWALVILIGVLIVVVVAIGGRLAERRITSGRRRKALNRLWAGLRERADTLADPILDLSTRVELRGEEAVSALYLEASQLYTAVRTGLDREASTGEADRLAGDLDRLDEMLGRVAGMLGAPFE